MSGALIARGAQKLFKVIRGTSKKPAAPSSTIKHTTPEATTNKINQKFQGRFFISSTYKGAEQGAKSFAKAADKADRLILKADLTKAEYNIGKKLFRKFRPRKSPFHPPSERQPALGRIILPKTALKKIKVDRKLTREVRKERLGGFINKNDYYKDIL